MSKIIDSVNELSDEKIWENASLNQLTDHIIKEHHGFLYEQLPKIIKLLTLILKVHGDNHPELRELHQLFHAMKIKIDKHLIKEERIIFPAVKEYEEGKNKSDIEKAINIIDELKKEHADTTDILNDLKTVTDDYKIPEDVCGTFELTYQKLQTLESDLMRHIYFENNILFPRLIELMKQEIN